MMSEHVYPFCVLFLVYGWYVPTVPNAFLFVICVSYEFPRSHCTSNFRFSYNIITVEKTAEAPNVSLIHIHSWCPDRSQSLYTLLQLEIVDTNDLVYPADERADLDVDSGDVLPAAAEAPGDEAGQLEVALVLAHEGAAAVTLEYREEIVSKVCSVCSFHQTALEEDLTLYFSWLL